MGRYRAVLRLWRTRWWTLWDGFQTLNGLVRALRPAVITRRATQRPQSVVAGTAQASLASELDLSHEGRAARTAQLDQKSVSSGGSRSAPPKIELRNVVAKVLVMC